MPERKIRNAPSITAPQGRCPICGKAVVQDFRPFCSRRCADVDLHRWLAGVYAVPVKEEEDEDGASPEAGRPAREDDTSEH
jgi:endogenous inhibitor of DNA gyrase (YacG/DUF329 family)